ncbi:hypothetical protein ACIF80_04785 [Streptomyces sp. NPDC085927]|uniref:hypothetical protein n=1 Tax=Streptomyces sp. NPDC085927 TaxID=3365738 RepID=UPI0037CD96D6
MQTSVRKPTRTPARVAALATAAVFATALPALPAVAATAQEAPRATAGTQAATVQAAAAKSHTYLSYKKNKKDPSNSRLSLIYVQQVNADKNRSWTVKTWRAGSGLGTKKNAKSKYGQDACKKSVGWLPNGTYKIEYFKNNFAGTINGHVWKLEDKWCKGKKAKRTELFIHSEMKSNGKQGRTEPTRWDGNGDYKSLGCIKLKPADARQLKSYRSSYPIPKKLYVS